MLIKNSRHQWIDDTTVLNTKISKVEDKISNVSGLVKENRL